VVGREIIRGGVLQSVVVNSRVSNVGTGEEGDARTRGGWGRAAARELGVPAETVLMSSTGVIGIPLPIEKHRGGDGRDGRRAGATIRCVGAEGIMTTDTYPKALSLPLGRCAVLTMVAKGSGMIEPNLATMLVYIFTDAAVEAAVLDRLLREVAAETFNMLSVDADTSTSDSCVILANGLAGAVAEEELRETLLAACTRMTELLARDGEGATKLLLARVEGAASREA
jgi:glutamate N-acetyltransferase / amino-acid N-acetyltransferase